MATPVVPHLLGYGEEMTFQSGVTAISRMDVEDIRTQARQAGIPVFLVSTAGGAGREAFFEAIRMSMPLDPPLEGSRSWDALSDSLWEGIRLLEADVVVVIWVDAIDFKTADRLEYDVALSVLEDIAESIRVPESTGERPKRLSIFVAEAPESHSQASS